METIRFRAKRLDNKQWIEGFYVEQACQANAIIAEHAIMQPNCYPVAIDPKTLGQYRPDIKAYDGDWIKAETNVIPVCKVEGFITFSDMECVIEQTDHMFPVCSFAVIDRLTVEVTGKNIFDNPELLLEDQE